uniref:Conjugal transfer protein TraP n=1 Tax=Pectobacterium carotovorum TaxID=554 RepID=A0A0N9NLD7_PECCA|nr:conjugal transfer protein TraP [Pectobacterium carotovorum]ALG88581.1 conjugal transfer protein TraP [Pectobacterium carotovorum]
MASKILSATVYGLSWLAWAFQRVVIWPAATLALILVLLFCMDGNSPGRALVGVLKQADSITDGQKWTWRKCPMGTKEELISNVPFPVAPEDCPVVVTDADEYASYIDRWLYFGLIELWLLLALSFLGGSYLLRRSPYHHRYGFIKNADGREYIRCGTSSHSQTGKGVSVVFPVRKESKKQRIFEVFTSSLAARKDDKEL